MPHGRGRHRLVRRFLSFLQFPRADARREDQTRLRRALRRFHIDLWSQQFLRGLRLRPPIWLGLLASLRTKQRLHRRRAAARQRPRLIARGRDRRALVAGLRHRRLRVRDSKRQRALFGPTAGPRPEPGRDPGLSGARPARAPADRCRVSPTRSSASPAISAPAIEFAPRPGRTRWSRRAAWGEVPVNQVAPGPGGTGRAARTRTRIAAGAGRPGRRPDRPDQRVPGRDERSDRGRPARRRRRPAQATAASELAALEPGGEAVR